MMAEWWEDDDKIHSRSPIRIWWMGTKKNAHRACPNWFSESVGLGVGSVSIASSAGESLGWRTSVSIIGGAANKSELGLLATVGGISWCIGNYAGGSIDAFYQYNHNGNHLGTAIIDWYVSKEQGVENFLINLHHWWESK